MLNKILRFLKETIWQMSLSDIEKGRAFKFRFARILVLTVRGFLSEQYALKAASLTYYTLLSVAPLIAVALGVARGFGFEDTLTSELLQRFEGQREILTQFLAFAKAILEHSQDSIFTVIGVFVLLWTTFKILSLTETSFNTIWGISKARKLTRQFTDYLAIILIAPLFFGGSNAAAVFLASQAHKKPTIPLSPDAVLSTASTLILILFPFLLTWALFTMLYIFMPNTKVRFSCGAAAAFVATCMYYLLQWGYFESQIGVSGYSAIYGSFAAIPLFLIWVNFSWLILLIGARLSFAMQNAVAYDFDQEICHISPAYKQLLSLYLLSYCIQLFQKGERPHTRLELHHHLKIPLNLLNQLTTELVSAGLLSEVKLEKGESAFQPAQNVQRLTVKSALDALNRNGSHLIPVAETPLLQNLKVNLATFDQILQNCCANIPLKDL